MSIFYILIPAITLLIIYMPKIISLYRLANLYNKRTIARNFINIDKIFKNISPLIPASDEPYIFE